MSQQGTFCKETKFHQKSQILFYFTFKKILFIYFREREREGEREGEKH